MAKNNPGDILTSDWNPVVGCERYSAGCRACWWFDGIMPWQQRLGNLPADLTENMFLEIEKRFEFENLRPKKGIVGVIQHGDLFWEKIPDEVIGRVLDMVDQVAEYRADKNKKAQAQGKPMDNTKYVLWTKRAERMANILCSRYPQGVPEYLACGVSVENQKYADERLPHLLRVKGHRFVMIEPMLGPIDLSGYEEVSWVVLGSETGEGAQSLNLDWARSVRDFSINHGIPFFLKQVGNSHKKPDRELDGRTWEEFPDGFEK